MAGSAAAQPGTPAGAQTLARGLAALELVATADDGVPVALITARRTLINAPAPATPAPATEV